MDNFGDPGTQRVTASRMVEDMRDTVSDLKMERDIFRSTLVQMTKSFGMMILLVEDKELQKSAMDCYLGTKDLLEQFK